MWVKVGGRRRLDPRKLVAGGAAMARTGRWVIGINIFIFFLGACVLAGIGEMQLFIAGTPLPR